MRVHYLVKNWLLLMLAIILVLVSLELSAEPARPARLPKEAFWLGGSDGGVFVLLKRKDDHGLSSYTGTIYHPYGAVWYKGSFILSPAGSNSIDPARQGQFVGWDGTQILLEDGRSLVAKCEK